MPHQQSGSDTAYEACLAGLLQAKDDTAPAGSRGCVAGVALLDVQGFVLYQRRVDPRLSCGEDCSVLSAKEGQVLAAVVRGLPDDGICQQPSLSCSGVQYRVFGGTPRGVYAVGPRRHVGLIVRALPLVGYLVVLYRRPYLAQQVVPHVEKFIDEFCDRQGFR